MIKLVNLVLSEKRKGEAVWVGLFGLDWWRLFGFGRGLGLGWRLFGFVGGSLLKQNNNYYNNFESLF